MTALPTMPGVWAAAVRPALDRILASGRVPGVILAVRDLADGDTQALALGEDGKGRPLTTDMLAPVASVTKLATALAVLRLAARNLLDLDLPVTYYLPAAQTGTATLRHLLSHTSGLPHDIPRDVLPYDEHITEARIAEASLALEPATAPGERVEYSNAGITLAALAVERATELPFPQALHALVLEPLGVEAYLGVDPPRPAMYVPGNYGHHTGAATEPFNGSFWLHLAQPYGGLVTNAAGMLDLACAFLPATGFLPRDLLADALTDQTNGVPGRLMGMMSGHPFPWGLGPDLHGAKHPHFAPPEASAGSFGHAGASGSLVWVDAAAGLAWAVLGPATFDRWWLQWAAIGSAVLAAHRR